MEGCCAASGTASMPTTFELPSEVVGQLGDAFDAQPLDEAEDRVVIRH